MSNTSLHAESRLVERLSRRMPRLVAAAFSFAALPTAIVMLGFGPPDGARMADSFFLTFAVVVTVVIAVSGWSQLRAARHAVISAAALYYTLVAILIAYALFMRSPLDLSFFADSAADSFKTVWRVAGPLLVVGLGVLVTGLLLINHWLLHGVAPRRSLPQGAAWLLAPGVPVLVSLWLHIPPAHAHLLRNGTPAESMRRKVRAVIPGFRDVTLRPGGPIVMLQLESVNALAANGQLDGRHEWTPNMHTLASRGVYFPYFVAAGPNTVRAQEGVLCAVWANAGTDLATRLDRINGPCLPELLARAGYRTVYLSDLPDPHFKNADVFMRRIGFADVRFADFMKGDDPRNQWGYTAPRFYERAFDYLRKAYPDRSRLFLYVAVSAQHFPWDHTGAPADAIPKPRNFRESYFNGLAEQDRGLATFTREFDATFRGDAHLFVFGDHSMPLDVQMRGYAAEDGAMSENFLTTLLYVPSRGSASRFRPGTVVTEFHGQREIIPTISELLNGNPYRHSLLPAMTVPAGRPREAPCATFIQAFEGAAVSVVREGNHYLYRFDNGHAIRLRLATDLLERGRRTDLGPMTWATFRRRFGCNEAP